MGDDFSQNGNETGGRDGFRMIQVHYIYYAIYFYSNPCLLHFRQILHPLSHEGSHGIITSPQMKWP